MTIIKDIHGRVVKFVGEITSGTNFDVCGNQYHFIFTDKGIVDVISGLLFPDGVVKSLLSKAIIPGRDLALTTVRSGITRSVFDPTVDIAANTADTSSNYEIMVRNGATNLVDTDITEWARFRFSTPDANTIREDNTVDTRVVRETFAGTSNCTFTLEIKPVGRELVQMEFNSGTYKAKFSLTGSGSVGFVSGAGTSAEIEQGSAGYYICTLKTVSASIDQVDIRGLDDDGNASYQGDTSKGYDVRNVRIVDSSVKHPSTPSGSAAGATYGTDIVSCSYDYGSVGSMMFVVERYGDWVAATELSSTPRIFEDPGNTFLYYDTNQIKFALNAGAVTINSGEDLVEGLNFVYVEWDGVNAGVSVNGSAIVSTATAFTPTTTMYIGNRSGGASVWHGAVLPLAYEGRKLSANERSALTNYYTALLANRILY